MSMIEFVEPVDVAFVCGYSHEEFSQLYACEKQRLAHLVYSTRIHKYELIDDLLPEDWD